MLQLAMNNRIQLKTLLDMSSPRENSSIMILIESNPIRFIRPQIARLESRASVPISDRILTVAEIFLYRVYSHECMSSLCESDRSHIQDSKGELFKPIPSVAVVVAGSLTAASLNPIR
eukprot:Blabericola_migrator_1__7836@NODE_4002_length_1391_cov_4_839124_g2467_i0_p2_GENE_NODE_4002_length_1391_cov_4_839124_g2467_i0NODE_4002_length_1391_cov_4_839124_g2467_i0_p2_ORF_typecomplete_len118_score6_14Nt_Gln_amidase/PF09764_9/0_012_NODE_4002_length_1391_cov_4_839124_g2467_i0515868